ncbi:MAG: CHAT domain-containing protein [Anaerolineae bacterium]
MKYQNFAVELAALPDGRYRVSVSSPVGDSFADVSSPYTDTEISDILAILGRERDGVTRTQMTDLARSVGDKLFNFLFRASADISNAYFASLTSMGSEGLRIRLSVERAGALSHLPWELVRDPARDYLTLSGATPVVRYTQQLSVRAPIPVSAPLRVLVMIASPADFPSLDVEGEWNRLQTATAPLQQRGLLQLERLDNTGLLGLQRKLRTGDYHVFHFIGHSDFDPATNQGVLVFENPDDPSKGQIISGAALARELGEESTIRLVLLNSCRSARRADSDPFAGIASGLVARGIPAVVAMQFEITDRAAQVFAEEFYRALADMLPIESAVSEGRRAIANTIQNTEWATPVLYMRSDSGVLFQTLESPVARPNQRPNWPIIAAFAIVLLLAVVIGVAGVQRSRDEAAGATSTAVAQASLQTATQSAAQTLTAQPTITPTINPAALPDLQIGRVRVVPNSFGPGQFFRVNMTITNAGSSPSGHFAWSWDANLSTVGTQQDTVDGEVDNIQPGSSKTISFEYLYGWWGNYTTQLIVDVDGEVNESDNRNNERVFSIDVQSIPFDIDFSLLPDTSATEPPIILASDMFIPWNMVFSPAVAQTDPCFASDLQLIDVDTDIVLTTERGSANCITLPLSVTFTRRFVSDVQVTVLPIQSGEATLAYFTNASDTTPLFTTDPVALTAGIPATLGGIDIDDAQIRRVEINMPGQPVRLTELILSPPPAQ